MLCDVKTTDKIRNDPLFKQNPMLVSKCLITDKHLSEYQLNQIKEKRESNNSNYNSVSKKLISNLGNCKLFTELQIKDDISNFNDKRYIIDNLTSKTHEINL